MSANVSKLLTAEDVAGLFQLSAAWVYKVSSGKRKPVLRRTMLHGSIRFKSEDVQEFIEECNRERLLQITDSRYQQAC